MDEQIIRQVFVNAFERSYTGLFSAMKNADRMPLELKRDFLEFIKAARHMFETTGNFSTSFMLKELPDNKWIPLYLEFCAQECRNRGCSQQLQPSVFKAVIESAEFQDEYNRIVNCKHIQ